MPRAEITLHVTNGNEMAEGFSSIAVLCAKIGALCEDVATEMRAMAKLGDKDAKSTEDAPATPKSIGDAATESSP